MIKLGISAILMVTLLSCSENNVDDKSEAKIAQKCNNIKSYLEQHGIHGKVKSMKSFTMQPSLSNPDEFVVTGIREISFSKEGYIQKQLMLDTNNNISGRVEYNYDEYGNLMGSIVYIGDKKQYTQELHYYNGCDSIVTIQSSQTNYGRISEVSSEVYRDGRIVENYIFKSGKISVRYSTSYVSNDSGCIGITKTGGNIFNRDYFNKNDLLIASKMLGQINDTSFYKYDGDGNIIYFYQGSEQSSFAYDVTYKFDEKNNWIEQMKNFNDGRVTFDKRSFEYY